MTQIIPMKPGRTLEIDMPEDLHARAAMLIMHYLRDDSGEFEASGGYIDTKPYVVIGIANMNYPFSLAEAREIAQSLQETMEKYPKAPQSMAVPDLILALRFAADQIEAIDVAKASVVN